MEMNQHQDRLRYRWIILGASFLVRFLVFGSLFAVGVLYVAWLDEFQTSKGNTAWIGSIATGSCLLIGPLASAIISRIGTRRTVVLGGVVMAIGMILSVFAPNIYCLFFTYGILAGCGGGITNLAAVVRLADYFHEERAFAMGVGSSGVGLGTFAFNVFEQYLLNEYGWRGTLLIIGGICLNICTAGLLMVHPRHLWKAQSLAKEAINVHSNEDTEAKPDVTNEYQDKSELTTLIGPSLKDIELDSSRDSNTAHEDDPRNSSANEEHRITTKNNEVAIKTMNIHKTSKDTKISLHNTSNKKNSSQRRKPSIFQKLMYKMKFTDLTISLWQDPVFILLFVSDFMSWMVQFVPYVHLPERARVLGISSTQSAILVSSMGFAGAVGKLCFGTLCTFLKFDPFKIFTIAQILFGVSTLLSPLCQTFFAVLLYAMSFGFLSGAYALMMVIPADLLGFQKFSAAYGFLLAGEGVGVYLGPPIAGWISDASDSYDNSFYCAGVVLLTSGLILLLRPCAERLKLRMKI